MTWLLKLQIRFVVGGSIQPALFDQKTSEHRTFFGGLNRLISPTVVGLAFLIFIASELKSIAIAALFTVGWMTLLLAIFLQKYETIAWTDDYIRFSGKWRRSVRIDWSHVSLIEVDESANIVLRSKAGERIRIRNDVHGKLEFLDKLAEQPACEILSEQGVTIEMIKSLYR